jgi:hypothetical protein
LEGQADQTILLAFQLAHANRRKIKKWLDTLSLGGEELDSNRPPRTSGIDQSALSTAARQRQAPPVR